MNRERDTRDNSYIHIDTTIQGHIYRQLNVYIFYKTLLTTKVDFCRGTDVLEKASEDRIAGT